MSAYFIFFKNQGLNILRYVAKYHPATHISRATYVTLDIKRAHEITDQKCKGEWIIGLDYCQSKYTTYLTQRADLPTYTLGKDLRMKKPVVFGLELSPARNRSADI